MLTASGVRSTEEEGVKVLTINNNIPGLLSVHYFYNINILSINIFLRVLVSIECDDIGHHNKQKQHVSSFTRRRR